MVQTPTADAASIGLFVGDTKNAVTTKVAGSGSWNTSHISHFFWSKAPAVSCQQKYSDPEASADDVLFTKSTETAANPDFTAGELKGLWRALSYAEWNHLFNTRTVNGETGEGHTCVKTAINERPGFIIVCDGYTGATENLTSIPEGCAFLPISGYRRDDSILSANICTATAGHPHPRATLRPTAYLSGMK